MYGDNSKSLILFLVNAEKKFDLHLKKPFSNVMSRMAGVFSFPRSIAPCGPFISIEYPYI